MKIVCGWGGKHMGGSRNDPQTSHSVCDDCYKKEQAEIRKVQKEKSGKRK